MNYQKLIFWLIFSIYWCDGYYCSEVEQMQDIETANKYRSNGKETLKSTYSILSESISQAVINESKYRVFVFFYLLILFLLKTYTKHAAQTILSVLLLHQMINWV